MLGLLLFISALAVLIICARMHDCYVDTMSLRVRDSDTNYREKKTPIGLSSFHCVFFSQYASSFYCMYRTLGRVVLSLMVNSQCRCAIIRCHMAGEYY